MKDNYERKDIDNSTIELTITIPTDNFEKSYTAVLKDSLKDTDIKGFRKGQIPENMVSDAAKQGARFDTLDKLAPFYINNALMQEKIAPIAPPSYKDLPKLEAGKDVVFTLTVTVMPEFKLGNLKKVSVKKEDVKIDKKEIDEALEEIKKTQETKAKEINDAWAKEVAKVLSLEEIKSLEDLRKHIENALKRQKEHMLLHKSQEDALKQGIKLSNIEIPEVAINFEAEEREKSFHREMEQRGVKVEDFVKANNTDIEEMRKLWKKDAQDAIETDVFLSLYMKEKGIEVTDEDLEKKIEEVKKTAPQGTDESIYDNPEWKEYVRRVEEKERTFDAFAKEVGVEHKHEEN